MIAGNREHCEAPARPAPSQVRPREGTASARTILVGLLIGVSAVISAALYATPRSPMSPHSLAFFGVALGEIALVIAWAAISRRHWLLRLACAVGVTVGFSALLPGHFAVTFPEFLGFLLVYVVGVGAPVVAARVLGCRYEAEEADSVAPDTDRRWRYSLAGLFAVTTAVALLAAVVRAAALPDGAVWILLGYEAAFVLVSLAALAPMLVRIHSARWVVLIVQSLVAAPILGSLAGSMEDSPGMFAWLALCQACYLIAAGWVLRAAGYRAAWRDGR